ncbi:BQ5605_C050g12473 [Microbotryum silenes-dioicae]|uniref:BQ5605_C050g12473 protein n=1 Tax=Microbotryum silenes-dioicae TaxID=796604 RepID=A0A2X0PH99_9BASI|nr:BQ5605_C050g12473 [Microbotryum silenes-dioicae]
MLGKGLRRGKSLVPAPLLLEPIRSLDLADSALLSLDQESAYNLVDHDWIMSVFRAMGAPERFLGLLNVIYRSVSLLYIINGYLTEAVRMLCGLRQGDPVSCPIWNVCFQPYTSGPDDVT